MSRLVVINALRFAGLLLFQVLVLNRLELQGFVSPYIYPLFILTLPFETPKWLLMLLGFFLGLSVDMFTDTPGLHAAATVFLAYLRPYITRLNLPAGGYETGDRPHIKSMGLRWFLVYAGIGILLHHLFYFYVEMYSFTRFFHTLAKAVASSAVTVMLCVLYEYIFAPEV